MAPGTAGSLHRTTSLHAADQAVGGVDCGSCNVRHRVMCSVLDDEEIVRLQAIVREIRLEPDQTLFFEGDRAEHVFNVRFGVLKVYKQLTDGRRQITGFFFAGDLLGFAADGGYSYCAKAITPATVCRIPRRALNALFGEFPKLEEHFLGMAADELVAAQDQMLLLGRKSAQERVASFLLRLSLRATRRGRQKCVIPLPMSRADIADYLGLTTETVSRMFGRLKRDGIIRIPTPHQVALLRAEELSNLASGDLDEGL